MKILKNMEKKEEGKEMTSIWGVKQWKKYDIEGNDEDATWQQRRKYNV